MQIDRETPDPCREAFDQLLTKRDGKPPLLINGRVGLYANLNDRLRYEGWQAAMAHHPEGAPAVPEAQAPPSAIKDAPSDHAGAAPSLETGPAQASGFADCCLPPPDAIVNSLLGSHAGLDAPPSVRKRDGIYFADTVRALLSKERTSRQQAQTQLEDMQEKRNRIGLDIDRALKGQVNEQSPIVGRLRLIAANFQNGNAP